MMLSRRRFLGAMSIPAVAGVSGAYLHPARLGRALAAVADLSADSRSPQRIAGDEDFWFEISQAFTVDRSIVNLNNGGVSPSPAIVQAAMKRHLDYSNTAPPYTMWRVLEPQREAVRERLAREFGGDPEEIALTRNASEGLQICQFGFDLKPGDEVLTTTQDYPRMLDTFKQRQRREGIVLRQFSIPVPAEDPGEIVSLFARHITSRTRLILMCDMINLTGQILPVQRVVAMARAKGIPVIVDGAHGFAHYAFKISDLDCDYYATSLHKWLFAPHGTGLLYVRRNKIRNLWPLMAAPKAGDEDIRKFEEIGTHPAANYLAIAEALTFHQGIGAKRNGAHGFAHYAFKISDLDCDYYATSLHKWLFAPHGTGLLYVRRNKIRNLWPLMAAPKAGDEDIRKFEEIGTHPAANYLAIAEALTFHQGIGAKRKEARLVFLRNYWANRLLDHDRVRLHTSLKAGFACGIATVEIEGVDSAKLNARLWDEHRILTTAITHEEFAGVRVSPSVYTTLRELDRFCDVMEKVIRHGLPT